MNRFNRALAVLILAATFLAATTILLISTGLLTTQEVLPTLLQEGPLADWLRSFSALTQRSLLLNVGLALVAMALAGTLLVFELRRPPRQPAKLLIKDDGLGQVEIRLDAIHRLVRYVASDDPNVLEIDPQVQPSAAGLRIHCRAAISPLASLLDTSGAFQQNIKESVERHLGVRVAEINVDAQFEPLDGQKVI